MTPLPLSEAAGDKGFINMPFAAYLFNSWYAGEFCGELQWRFGYREKQPSSDCLWTLEVGLKVGLLTREQAACTWPFPTDWTTWFSSSIWKFTENPQRLSLSSKCSLKAEVKGIFYCKKWLTGVYEPLSAYLCSLNDFRQAFGELCISSYQWHIQNIMWLSLFCAESNTVLFIILYSMCPSSLCFVGSSALVHRGSFPDGGVPQWLAFPLPSAFCCEHRGWKNVIALGGKLEEEASALVLVSARLGLKNRFLIPKPPSWHLGITGARLWHPLSVLPAVKLYVRPMMSRAVPQEITKCQCHLSLVTNSKYSGFFILSWYLFLIHSFIYCQTKCVGLFCIFTCFCWYFGLGFWPYSALPLQLPNESFQYDTALH